MRTVKDLLLVTDMDGTLLTTEKTISRENREAIREFQQAGGRFTIATGRSIPSLRQYVDLLEIDTPTILYNGGIVYDYTTERICWKTVLEPHVKDYVDYVYDRYPTVGIEVMLGEEIYIIRNNAIVDHHMELEHLPHEYVRSDEIPEGWYKVLFALEPSEMDAFEADLRARCHDVFLVRSFTHYFEMLPFGCCKGNALPHLAEASGILLSRTVGIGDYYNDRELIVNAGIGATVANAPQELKALADIVTCDNDHSAIADLIHRLMNSVNF